MFRIRFHGRGGQGIKTSSRILGSAFFHEGFEVQDAPVYGAERRGAPLTATVRAARAPIHERGAINHPDLVIVADDSLVPIPAAGVLLGVSAHSALLLNSAVNAGTWRTRLNLAGPILILPVNVSSAHQHPHPLPSPVKGEGKSEETSFVRSELPYIGARCAGAGARLVGCIRRESLAQALRDELSDMSAEIIEANLEHALGVYDALQVQAGIVREGTVIDAVDYVRPDWILLPFEDARRAAPDIHGAATSVQIKTGAWRSWRPVIDVARCKHCSWVCSTMCPDSAIKVRADGAPEIDYDHCKGCLICAAVCPPHAIRAVPERDFINDAVPPIEGKHDVPNNPPPPHPSP